MYKHWSLGVLLLMNCMVLSAKDLVETVPSTTMPPRPTDFESGKANIDARVSFLRTMARAANKKLADFLIREHPDVSSAQEKVKQEIAAHKAKYGVVVINLYTPGGDDYDRDAEIYRGVQLGTGDNPQSALAGIAKQPYMGSPPPARGLYIFTPRIQVFSLSPSGNIEVSEPFQGSEAETIGAVLATQRGTNAKPLTAQKTALPPEHRSDREDRRISDRDREGHNGADRIEGHGGGDRGGAAESGGQRASGEGRGGGQRDGGEAHIEMKDSRTGESKGRDSFDDHIDVVH
jgi:hypothetical protein